MGVLKTPNIRPGHCFVVEDGVLVVDGGRLSDLVRTDGDDTGTDIYLHRRCAGVLARWCGAEEGRLN
jgi:hypothetical protein